MALSCTLPTFAELHRRARRGALRPRERSVYRLERRRFLDELLAVQNAALPPAERPRRDLRAEQPFGVALRVGAEAPLAAEALNVSRGGCAVAIARPVAAGALVELQLCLPEAERVHARARVVYCRPHQRGVSRVGLEFVALGDPAAAERIEDCVLDGLVARL